MNKKTSIMISIISIIILIIIQISFTYYFYTNYYTKILNNKEVTLPLNILSLQASNYDAVLSYSTHSALLHAMNNEYSKINNDKITYSQYAIKLENILQKDVPNLLNRTKRTSEAKNETINYLILINKDRINATALEYQVFNASENKDTSSAYKILMGNEYKTYKEKLFNHYYYWSILENKETAESYKDIIKESKEIIYFSTLFSILMLIAIIINIILFRSLVSDKYQLLYEYSNDALMTLAPPTWKFTSGNSAALKLFKIKKQKEFISLSPVDLSPKKQPDGQLSSVKAKRMINAALINGSAFFKWTHITKKGEPFHTNILLSRIEINGVKYLQATVRKI